MESVKYCFHIHSKVHISHLNNFFMKYFLGISITEFNDLITIFPFIKVTHYWSNLTSLHIKFCIKCICMHIHIILAYKQFAIMT